MVARVLGAQDAGMSTSSKCLTLLGIAATLALAPAAGAATTQSFTSPGEHVFVVPAAVTSGHVALVGASGGNGAGGSPGGDGAGFGATIAVTPGQKLFAEVGGNGASAAAGGTDGVGGKGGGGTGGNAVFLFVG